MMTAAAHGPWALVAGASEGLGAAFVHAIAARGLDVVLLARSEDKLRALAAEVEARHGVQTRVVVADLSKPDVGATVEAATADLDVGLLVYNACRSVIGEFLELSLEDKLGTLDVNCRGLVQLTSVYAPKLVARGRGGLLIMSSMSGFQGTAMVGTYAATKAFDTVLGEALWEELQPQGVDVLVCAAGATRTPGFDRNTPEDKRADAFPMTADEVAEAALGQLGHGPTFVPGALNRFAYLVTTRLLPRRLAIRFLSRTTRGLYA